MTYTVFDHFNALDAVGVSRFMVADNFNVDLPTAELPGPPTNLVVENLDSGARITWTAAQVNGAQITGYRAIATMSGGGSLHYFIPAEATTAILASLTNGEGYSVILYAETAIGNGPATPPATALPTSDDPDFDPLGSDVVLPAETEPSAPVLDLLVASDGAIGAYWTAPVDDGGAAITEYRATATSDVDVVVVSVVGTAVGAVIGPLTNGEAYTVHVQAINVAGGSDLSNELSETPLEGLPPITDLPGWQPPPPPPPYREPEPIYAAFAVGVPFAPSFWRVPVEGEVGISA